MWGRPLRTRWMVARKQDKVAHAKQDKTITRWMVARKQDEIAHAKQDKAIQYKTRPLCRAVVYKAAASSYAFALKRSFPANRKDSAEDLRGRERETEEEWGLGVEGRGRARET